MSVAEMLGWVTSLINGLGLRDVLVGMLIAFATVGIIHELRGGR